MLRRHLASTFAHIDFKITKTWQWLHPKVAQRQPDRPKNPRHILSWMCLWLFTTSLLWIPKHALVRPKRHPYKFAIHRDRPKLQLLGFELLRLCAPRDDFWRATWHEFVLRQPAGFLFSLGIQYLPLKHPHSHLTPRGPWC